MDDALRHLEDDDETCRVGVFRTWKSLYWGVIVYTLGLIALLYVLTVVLDHGVS